MRICDTIILKKNKCDIWENYHNNDFILISNSSKYDVLKHSFINIIIIIEKKELLKRIKHFFSNNVNYNYLIIIKTLLYLFLYIYLINTFLTQKSITIIYIILLKVLLNY